MCYYVSPTPNLNWIESRDTCIEMGATLIEIRDEQKSKRIASLGKILINFYFRNQIKLLDLSHFKEFLQFSNHKRL